MVQFFETKIRYSKMQNNGKTKKVTDTFVVDSQTVTEAEALTVLHTQASAPEDSSVISAKQTKISEVINTEGVDNFYLVKYTAVTFDENTGSEKENMIEVLVGADDFDEAVKEFKKSMENFNNYEINSIALTPVLEVIHGK